MEQERGKRTVVGGVGDGKIEGFWDEHVYPVP